MDLGEEGVGGYRGKGWGRLNLRLGESLGLLLTRMIIRPEMCHLLY